MVGFIQNDTSRFPLTEFLVISTGIPALFFGMLMGIPSYEIIESTPNLEKAIAAVFDNRLIRTVFLSWLALSALLFAVRTERWNINRFELRLLWICASLLGIVGGAAAIGLSA